MTVLELISGWTEDERRQHEELIWGMPEARGGSKRPQGKNQKVGKRIGPDPGPFIVGFERSSPGRKHERRPDREYLSPFGQGTRECLKRLDPSSPFHGREFCGMEALEEIPLRRYSGLYFFLRPARYAARTLFLGRGMEGLVFATGVGKGKGRVG